MCFFYKNFELHGRLPNIPLPFFPWNFIILTKKIESIYFDILGINWCLNKILTFVPSKILAYKALCFVWYYTSIKIIFLCSYKKIYINSQHTQNKNTSREGETSWIKLKGKHRQPQFENHKRSIIKFVVHKFDKRIFKRKRFFFSVSF